MLGRTSCKQCMFGLRHSLNLYLNQCAAVLCMDQDWRSMTKAICQSVVSSFFVIIEYSRFFCHPRYSGNASLHICVKSVMRTDWCFECYTENRKDWRFTLKTFSSDTLHSIAMAVLLLWHSSPSVGLNVWSERLEGGHWLVAHFGLSFPLSAGWTLVTSLLNDQFLWAEFFESSPFEWTLLPRKFYKAKLCHETSLTLINYFVTWCFT